MLLQTLARAVSRLIVELKGEDLCDWQIMSHWRNELEVKYLKGYMIYAGVVIPNTCPID
jgi:hypothetical protein